MSEAVQSMTLLRRLERIRQIARRRWLVYGVHLVASGGVYALLTIVVLDWWLLLPPALRLIIGLFFIVGFALAATYWIYRPLRTRLGLDDVAARIERYFGDLNDQLSSSVHFASASGDESPDMIRRVLKASETIVATRDIERILTIRPLMLSTALLMGSMALLVGVATVSPRWLWTGIGRYLDPFGAIEWPTTVQIMPLTRNLRVPSAEAARLRMRITQGLTDTLRATVHLRDAEGRVTTLALNRESDYFETVVEPVLTDMTYWFEAGDASTRAEPGRIRLLTRPQIEEALLSIRPPVYADTSGEHSVVVRTLTTEPVELIRGSRVELVIRSSKPANRAAVDQISALIPIEGEPIPLAIDANDARYSRASFEIQSDLTFRVHLVDAEGCTNQTPTLYSLVARDDAAPRVTPIQPASSTDCTPTAVLPLRAEVEDDFGIVRTAIESRRIRGDANDELPTNITLPLADVRASVSVDYPWELSSLGLKPGDVLTFTIAAEDNFPQSDGQGQIGRSPPIMARIISTAEFERRVREQLHVVERQLRETMMEQEDVVRHIDDLTRRRAEGEVADRARDELVTLHTRQSRLTRVTRDLSRRVRSLAAQMEHNRVDRKDWPERVRDAGERLAGAASGPLSQAAAMLSRAREPGEEHQPHLDEAATQGRSATVALRAALEALTQAGDVEALTSTVRDLIDRQASLRQSTAEVGRDTLGRTSESLTPQQKAALEQIARQQENLGNDAARAIEQMRELASLGSEDPEHRESLDAAIHQADAGNLERHMKDAARDVRDNRTSAANARQQAAENTLRKLAETLTSTQRTRKMDELRKQLQRAQDAVAELLKRQEALNKATNDAARSGGTPPAGRPSSTAMGVQASDELVDEQRQIRTNTRWLADDLAQAARTNAVAVVIRQAVDPMSRAHDDLAARKFEEALVPQEQAAELLRQARDELNKLEEEAERDALRRTLDEVRRRIAGLLEAQKKLHADIEVLSKQVLDAGKVGRAEAKVASDLARDQMKLAEQADEHRAEMGEAPVFSFALQRISRWMREEADRLTRRAITPELPMLSRRIIRELEVLLSGIDATDAMIQKPRFAGQDGGGAGDGQSGSPSQDKPVPTLTELLVLKALQLDINERTRAAAEAMVGGEPSEEQLAALRALGEDQQELRRLTQQLTEEARRMEPR